MKTILVTRNSVNNCNDFIDLTISLEGTSEFPGQTVVTTTTSILKISYQR